MRFFLFNLFCCYFRTLWDLGVLLFPWVLETKSYNENDSQSKKEHGSSIYYPVYLFINSRFKDNPISHLGWYFVRRLYPDFRIPLSGRQNRDLVEELIDSRQNILPTFGPVCDFPEYLKIEQCKVNTPTFISLD